MQSRELRVRGMSYFVHSACLSYFYDSSWNQRTRASSQTRSSVTCGSFKARDRLGKTTQRTRWRRKRATPSVRASTIINDKINVMCSYREVPDLDTRHPLVTVFAVPAQALLSYNLEILIQTTPSTSSPTEASSQDFLVPALDLPNSDSGITSLVTHPVHKSIVVAEGLDNVPTIIFPFLSKSLSIHDHSQTIKGVVDTPWNNLQEDAYSQHLATPVNLILAEKAINSLRDSLDKAIDYEHAWFSSGLASVSKWFVEGLETKQAGLKPTLRRLIQVIIKNAEHAISNEEQADSQRTKSSSVPISTRSSLDQDIVGWAEFAHTELRAQLDFSFSSKNWKKLAWWKLFWRIDDIGYIASDILQRAWLVQAEKEMIWLSGRIEQAGLGDPDTPTRTPDMGSLSEKPRIGDAPPALRISEIVEHMSQNRKSENMPFGDVLRPWPTALSRIRQRLTKETTPPLQAFAQRLLFQTISTTLLTSSLAALLYVSISTTSLYEAGGIGAVGFVYSMHRLQGKWRLARDNWEANVREEGRMALRGAEETMRKLVRDGGQEVLDEERNEERILARDRVEQLRKALEEVDR